MSTKYMDVEMALDFDPSLAEGPETALERNLIAEYLLSRGYRLQDLKRLPKQLHKKLMEEASRYASLRLSEIESRNRFRQEIRATGGQR